MPRSQRITCPCPSATTYSADSRSSKMVAAIPRFSSTGLPQRPARAFCQRADASARSLARAIPAPRI
jgi:hypothetical protein